MSARAHALERAAPLNAHPRVVAAHRRSSLALALPGLGGVLLAPLHAWFFGVTATDLAILAVAWWLTLGPGLSVGYHRHFAHRSFAAPRAVRRALAVLGSMGAQGPLLYWVAVHRRHHEHGDAPGDPHSPHQHGRGLGGTLRGLWHAHYGWSLASGMPSSAHYCPDLAREPWIVAVSRQHRRWVLVGLALPALAGLALTGTARGALGGFVWGGLVRLFLTSNLTWSLNSICHRFGARAFETADRSVNNAWLALPTLGESWHNNHHARPACAAHGRRWWQLDPNYACIRALAALGLASEVRRPHAEPQNRE